MNKKRRFGFEIKPLHTFIVYFNSDIHTHICTHQNDEFPRILNFFLHYVYIRFDPWNLYKFVYFVQYPIQ